jgi:hypothetical protein
MPNQTGDPMNRLFFTLLLACIVIMNNCTGPNKSIIKPDSPPAAIEKRNLMIGKWYGEIKNEKGELQQWLVTRFGDGSYTIHFRLPEKDKTCNEQIEVGVWGVSGPIYFSITKGWVTDSSFIPSDPRDPSYYDAYEIIEINQNKFEYRSFDTDMTFEVKRVGDDFRLPEIAP